MSNIQNEIIMENIFDEILGDMEAKFPFMNESERTRKAIELAEKQFEDTIPYLLHFRSYRWNLIKKN